MHYAEFLRWVQYRNARGSIDPGVKLDKTLAFIATVFGGAMLKKQGGAKFSINDFTPWSRDDDQDEAELTPDLAIELLRSLANAESKSRDPNP